MASAGSPVLKTTMTFDRNTIAALARHDVFGSKRSVGRVMAAKRLGLRNVALANTARK
jgi:hypothetical protein